MGSYTFTWEHSANEVFVTGDFDDWKKTVQLTKEDGIFKKTVELPKSKVLYKFVVDGEWTTNDSAPKESDGAGNHNNVLGPDDIVEQPVSTLSSAAPTSTTAALAAAVAKESDKSKSEEYVPGAFPLTPPAETPSMEPQAFSINPIPATDGPGNPVTLAPGEKVPDPSTLTNNTIESTVKHDKPQEEQTFGVAPIPASEGLGNPITLAPGEKVPDASTLTSHTVQSTVKTDPESYEKSDALPTAPPQLAPVVTPAAERKSNGGLLGDAAIAPFTVQSAGPTSTTAELAAAVPKETSAPKEEVPETVTESQKEAGFAPEASANPVAVDEKAAMEQELKAKVPEEPAAAGNTITDKAAAIAAPVAVGATAAAGAVAAAAYMASEKAADAVGLNGKATAAAPATNEVPEVVTESQKEAHASPEAAANPVAVDEKATMEQELKAKVPEETPAAESTVKDKAAAIAAPVAVGATAAAGTFAAATYAAKEKAAETVGLNGQAAANEVPAVVTESQQEAHASPEAAANPEAVHEKKAVESELLKEVTKTNEAGEPAPTVTAATTATAPVHSDESVADAKPAQIEPTSTIRPVEPEPAKSEPGTLNASADKPAVPPTSRPAANDSRDVSPMSKPATNVAEPTVVTGTETTTADTKSTPETPKKDSESSKATPESSTADKKKKRRSFFGKLKEKFSSKS